MKYLSIILLLYCIEIMAGGFVNAMPSTFDNGTTAAPTLNQTAQDSLLTVSSVLELNSTNSHIEQTSAPQTSDNRDTSPPPPLPPSPSSQTPSTTSQSRIFKEECRLLLMVAGGLILACAILLISTFFLACKVCQLSRRIKMLSSNSDLISKAEYWIGTAKKNENKSETEDAKETTVLMSDLGQTCDEAGDDGSKEEKGNQDGHKAKGVSENGGEVGDAAKTEETSAGENTKETPATIAENSSTSKPQEEAGDSQSTKAEENSSAEGKEEAKDAA